MAASVNKILPAVVVCVIALLFGASAFLPVSKDVRAIVYRLGIVTTIESIIFAGSRYCWHHVSRTLARPGGRAGVDVVTASVPTVMCTKATKLFVLTVLGMAQFSFLSNFVVASRYNWISYASYVCLGLLLHAGFFLIILNAGYWTFWKVKLYLHRHPGATKQRSASKFSSQARLLTALVYGLSIGCYGLYNASLPPSVKHVEISIKSLGPSQDGIKIVQVSDIHLGPTVGRDRLLTVVNIVNSLKPDIVVVVGDLVDGQVPSLREAIQPVRDLRSRLGIYYVTGNHEYYSGKVDDWFEELTSLGFTVLHNSHVQVPQDSSSFFYLAGIDDPTATMMHYDGHGMDLEKAVGSCDPRHPVILLAHQPRAAKAALDSKYGKQIQLVLSGHTHGGQMFPVIIGAYLANPFFRGLYEYNGSHVYVSEGTLYWGIPMRIGSSMEVTEIVLRSAQGSSA